MQKMHENRFLPCRNSANRQVYRRQDKNALNKGITQLKKGVKQPKEHIFKTGGIYDER